MRILESIENRMNISRRDFMSSVSAACCSILVKGCANNAKPTRPPSVILILSDDQGYADIGVQGPKDVLTPNMDSIAQAGVRFTDGYVSSPVCSPSRAGIMTGRYQQRFGHWFNGYPPSENGVHLGLPLSETTLAQLLKTAGYHTGLIGKWHLGADPGYLPQDRGFDEFFGFLRSLHSYTNWDGGIDGPIYRGREPEHEKEYLTEAFTREAVDFIGRNAETPFFLYLCYNAVHTPLEVPDKYLQRHPDIADPERRKYLAMLSAMDDGIGAVLDKLKECRIADDTLVVFLSDNGAVGQTVSNYPFRGAKKTIREGGLRVPFLMQWPKHIQAGQVYREPVIALDLFPTIAAAAGAVLPKDRSYDGVCLLPYLNGEIKNPPHDMLFWKWLEGEAARSGKWKLFKSKEGILSLYDIKNDAGETADLSGANVGIVKHLDTALSAWVSQLAPPLWTQGKSYPVSK